MQPLTTEKAILIGLLLIALSIASIPYSSNIIAPALATNGVTKITICDNSGFNCVGIKRNAFQISSQ